MLYPAQGQLTVLLIIFSSAFACGFLFDIANFALYFVNRNKIMKNVFYAFSTFFSLFFMFFINIRINYGRFRIFLVLIAIIAMALERLTFGKLLSKLYQLCYNKGRKFFKKEEKNGREKVEKSKGAFNNSRRHPRGRRNRDDNSGDKQAKQIEKDKR